MNFETVLSRPGPLSLVSGTIEPDLAAIERGLARKGVDDAAMVISCALEISKW